MTTALEEEFNRLSKDYPEIAKHLRAFLGDGKQVQSKNNAPPVEERKEVFLHWATAFRKDHVRFRSGSKRDLKIVARLKSMGKESVIKAISGFALDPWRHEELVRHELATLLRSDEQVEAGMEIFDKGGRRDNNRRGSQAFGSGNANATVSFRREDTPRLPSSENNRGEAVSNDQSGWGAMRWGRVLGEEEDPFG